MTAASSAYILELRDLSFRYAGSTDTSHDTKAELKATNKTTSELTGNLPSELPGELALKNLNLKVKRGSFVGILGPAGSGKTTLAASLSGAIPHHFSGDLYGAALIDGKDSCELSLTDIAQTVGSVLQDIDAQMVSSIVEDELLYGLENFGVAHEEIEARVQEALTSLGIEQLRYREIATLSGGQKQKVAIAAILALQPQVLVLDEPTAALDPVSSEHVYSCLKEINQRGITVVVIEQKVALLSRYCSEINVLDHGSIVLSGTPYEVFSHADELRELGVDSPRAARVARSLYQHGLLSEPHACLSVEEAHDLLEGLLSHPESINTKRLGSEELNSQESLAGKAAQLNKQTETSNEPRVKLEHVSYHYPTTGDGIQDVSFEVYPGECVAIIGQNGAGKTTLTKLLNGLLRPDSGVVTICGHDTRLTATSEIARYCSTLFQNPDHQICKISVLDEVAFGLELHGVTREEAQARAREVIERFGLNPTAEPFSLSRGQRQKVALASVVVMKPQVVLLDEPTNGLDYRECMTVMQTVTELCSDGCSVIMVCHDMEVVSDFTQRLIVMAQGQQLAQGQLQDIFKKDELLRAAFIEAPHVMQLAQRLEKQHPAFANAREVRDIIRITLQEIKENHVNQEANHG